MSNFIYGKNTIEVGINSKKIKIYKILYSNLLYFEKLKKFNITDITFEKVDEKKLSSITKGNHQGVVAFYNNYQYIDLDELLDNNKDRQKLKVIILNNLTDINNLGSIIRTSYAMGIDAIIIPKNRQAELNEVAHKKSSGASLLMDIVKVTNLSVALEKLKNEGFWIYSSQMNSDNELSDIEFSDRSAVILGSEDKGISSILVKKSDFSFKIKMSRNFNSINVSNAASIIIYTLTKK